MMGGFADKYESLKNDFLTRLKKNVSGAPKYLQDSIDYSLYGGGKRLRPILFLSVLNAYGKIAGDAEYMIASAIECIHIYSLIHDDLPAMDNDDFRRGEPSNHKKFGEATALLAGDALINFAYQLLICAAKMAPEYIDAAMLISKNAGVSGMIGGQAIEFEGNAEEFGEEKLLEIYDKKSGHLIKAAILAGAIVCGCNGNELVYWEVFGHNFGFAFQIKDDLLDAEQQSEYATLLKLWGKDEANEKLQIFTNEAFTNLNKIAADTAFIKWLAESILKRQTDGI